MPLIRRRFLLQIAGAALAAPGARAQAYPTRPIKWLCAQAAGGTMDLTTRAIQPFLQQLGVRTQLTYVPGGGGNVARTEMYHSPPDGYSIMTDTAPSPALGQVVAHADFDVTDMEPIYAWSIEGWQICTQKNSAVKNLNDLVALSRQRPIVAGSIGRGGASHLQLLLLQKITGMPMHIVHFSGSAQAYPQVIGGNIDIACSGPGSASRTAENLQFLCIFRDHEPALPEVSAARSQGFDVPSVDQIWYAMTAPKVPEDRLDRLESLFAEICKMPAFAEAQAKAGIVSIDPVPRQKLKQILKDATIMAKQYEQELSAG